ncbi:MAG: orotidine-5'-phosphate decarboxylase [bacterium]|nr:orotidine-5'-phosphate decarboxylase [bacterium]
MKDKIIVALDVSSLEEARPLVESLSEHVSCFKVGLELATAVGAPKVVKFIHDLGGKVFYDGKFSDIPNTVGRASKVISDLGVHMFNVHVSCGREAMLAAVDNKGFAKVLAVTVLTSLSVEDVYSMGYAACWPGVKSFESYEEADLSHYMLSLVNRMSLLAKGSGVDGVICSPQELIILRNFAFMKVTPGVRPSWAAKGDQKRVMTPAEAIKAGATALVIGRPITEPPREVGTPVDAVKRIYDEIASL